MGKRIKISFLLLLSIFMLPISTKALENNYVNQNGVSIDISVYEKLVNIYSTNYIETLTEEEFQKIVSNDIEKIVVEEYQELNNPIARGTSHSTTNKTVKLVKNGNLITLIATWKTVPKVKSYDVIAVRLEKVTLKSSFSFKQTYLSNGKIITSYDSYNKSFNNGFGSSFKVGDGTGHEFSLDFTINGTGVIYGSYQHASTSATLENSKNYTISYLGLGGVINFDSNVRDKYDAMSGVNLSV